MVVGAECNSLFEEANESKLWIVVEREGTQRYRERDFEASKAKGEDTWLGCMRESVILEC